MRVINHVPAGTTYQSATLPDGVSESGKGTFLVSELPSGATTTFTLTVALDPAALLERYVNAAEIAAFDNDSDSANDLPGYVVDSDSTPSNGNADDVINHNDAAYDPDVDGLLTEPTAGDEDDHDIEPVVLPFDLSLHSELDAEATTFPLEAGSTVTFQLMLANEGRTVEMAQLVDYLDAGQFRPFDATLNPDGTTTGDVELPYVWDTSDPLRPIATLTGPIALGDVVKVPVTLRIVDQPANAPLVNRAEVASFDDDVDPDNAPPLDVDSTPDLTNDADEIEDDRTATAVDVFDLALRLTLSDDTILPIQPDQDVTFDVEVFNQGSTFAESIEVIAFSDDAMWLPFDATKNPAGDGWAWAASGADGVLTLDEAIAPGASSVVPVTLTLTAGADLTSVLATAEIVGAVASNGTTPVTNADGSIMTDFDSTPDATNDDVVVDDDIANTNGDEDDHDIASVEPPTYSLGSQVWQDDDNDGSLDATETLIEGVAVHLFTDADGDDAADDRNGDGSITLDDAVAVTVTDEHGAYLFPDLETGSYVVGVAPSNWSVDEPLEGAVSSEPTESDPDTDVSGDDNGSPCDCPDGYVFSGAVTLAGNEPLAEPGVTQPASTPDADANQTVDFGFWWPMFDLALAIAAPTGPITAGQKVDVDITLSNMGNVDASDIEIVVDLPSGATVDSSWTLDDGGDARRTIDQALRTTESMVLPMQITFTQEATELMLSGEVMAAMPLDSEGRPLRYPNGLLVPEASTGASVNNGLFETQLTVQPAVSTQAPLPLTGSATAPLTGAGMALIAAGWLVLGVRRRSNDLPA